MAPGSSSATALVRRIATARETGILIALLLVIVAAMLEKYPFVNRLILFLLPSWLVLMAAAVEAIAKLARDREGRFAVATLLVFAPLAAPRSAAISRSQADHASLPRLPRVRPACERRTTPPCPSSTSAAILSPPGSRSALA